VVGLVIRWLWVQRTLHDPELLSDPTFYRLAGREVALGHGYRNGAAVLEAAGRAFSGEPVAAEAPYSAFYPPGYPFLLGALFWLGFHSPITDDTLRLATGLNVLLDTANILLLFLVVRRLFGNRPALVAAAIYAVYPNAVAGTAIIRYETSFVFLTLAVLLLVLHTPMPGGVVARRRLVLLGLVIGAIAYVRPTIALLVPALAIAWRVAGASWKRTLGQAAALTVLVVVTLVPWTVRNAVRMDSPVLVSTGIGPALCASRHPGAHGEFIPATLDRYCLADNEGFSREEAEVRNNSESTRTAIEFVLEHPVSEVNQWFWRTNEAYQGDHDAVEEAEDEIPPPWLDVLLPAADGIYFAVLALALLGAVAWADRRRPDRLVVLLFACGLAVVPLLLHGDPRYKAPLIPLLIGMAAVALVTAWDGLRAARAPG
jgi:4-amino-4-deoxy-L-arabinose transferase-like glycosyltransferase